MNIYDMIYNGNFGNNQPVNYASSNMVPFGYSGYNQAMPEQYTPQQYQPVYQPLPQQPQYQYSAPGYGVNDYYHPYTGNFSTPGYSTGYDVYNNSYNNWYNNGFNNYINPMQSYQTVQEEINKEIIKRRMAASFFNKPIDEGKIREELNRKYDPRSYEKEIPLEERQNIEEYRYSANLYRAFRAPDYKPAGYDYCCAWINEYNKMQQLQGHGLVQFLAEDVWQLEREYFVEQYIMPRHDQGRDLSQTYNSKEYNQLLALHSSNQTNPYVNQLMDDSRYDNNVYDEPVGLNAAINREHSRVERLREMLPLLEDEETVKRRQEWTNEIAKQIMAKGAMVVV